MLLPCWRFERLTDSIFRQSRMLFRWWRFRRYYCLPSSGQSKKNGSLLPAFRGSLRRMTGENPFSYNLTNKSILSFQILTYSRIMMTVPSHSALRPAVWITFLNSSSILRSLIHSLNVNIWHRRKWNRTETVACPIRCLQQLAHTM